jgi:hypothetical protein
LCPAGEICSNRFAGESIGHQVGEGDDSSIHVIIPCQLLQLDRASFDDRIDIILYLRITPRAAL